MTNFLFVLIALCFSVQFSLSFFKQLDRSSQRRIYWACAGATAVFAFLTVYPDLQKGLGMGAMFTGGMVFIAYAYTPYLKIGGKIYSATIQHSRPDPDDTATGADENADYDPNPNSYSGILNAPKIWWMLVPLLVISSGNIYIFTTDRTDILAAIIGFGFLLFLPLALGYGDASWDYPIARGQYLQFALIGIVTAGAFTVLYLLAYYAGKLRPLRNKRSLEYRSHPRHQRQDES